MEILSELYNIWMEILSDLYIVQHIDGDIKWTVQHMDEDMKWTLQHIDGDISFVVSEVTGFDDVGDDKLAGFLSVYLAGLNGYAICECIQGIQYWRWQGSNATYGTPTTTISNQDECFNHHPDPSYKTCKSHKYFESLLRNEDLKSCIIGIFLQLDTPDSGWGTLISFAG